MRIVPRLRRNLTSARQVGDEGCIAKMNGKNWKVSKGFIVVAKGVKVGTLYLCTSHIVSSTLIVIEKSCC